MSNSARKAGTEPPGQNEIPSSSMPSNSSAAAAQGKSSTHEESIISPSCIPQRPFPSVVNAYYQLRLAGLKKFFICGAHEDDRICLVDVHTGYSCKPPLGSRPGVHLHRALTPDDAVLAAAGDESRFSARVYALDNTSVILLPPLDDDKSNSQQLVNEPMHAKSADGREGVAADKAVRFVFSVEVGRAMHREQFEWVKTAKAEEAGEEDIKAGAYKLVRLPTRSDPQASASSLEKPGTEIVAVLTFVNVWSSLKHAFSLDLRGNRPILGDRWALMAVMTALRLWSLRVNGRTSKTVVAAGEKVRGS